ncbi:hypothetical protein Q0590_25100 [Rhodocytophaga aerolata]|uniref:Efflux transporter periplasmic adaptor subunit n=1 Tax=Rhodocytophaga aerolata TaxID=455078 RepID=A0ABT8RBV5_9BACT|nr:hypothetical protein [Rhodocytophaga aerolata]MDO1449579.1 hypothetical protein [Rhodocytophaga aerolata]
MLKNKKVLYALIAVVIIAAVAGFIVWKKKLAAKAAGTSPLAAKQDKVVSIKKA